MTKKAKRIWSIIGAVFIAFGIYAWFYGTATLLVVQARRLSKEHPAVNLVPVRLSNTSISTSPGRKVSVGDYEFEIPWTDFDERLTPKSDSVKSFIARDGLGILVFAQASDTKAITEDKRQTQAAFDAVFGQGASLSDYTFTKTVLQVRPEQVRLFAPRRELVSRSMSLSIKSVTLPSEAKSGIYSIDTPAFSGFQYGNPDIGKTIVHLFTDAGHVELVFSGKGARTVSQAEINRVVQTFRKKD